MDESATPRLPRHVKLRFDKARVGWVLLAPERVLVLDPIALAILQRCTGEATLGAILDDLAGTYAADRAEIARDVTELLDDLAARGMVEA